MNQEFLEHLKRLKIMDDDFGRIVFKEKASALEVLKILEVVDERIDIIHYETQYDLKVMTNRSIVFDVFVVSNKGYIDMELENSIERAAEARARYHQALSDVHMTPPESKLDKLPKNIVIFICSFDLYQKGLPVYTVKRKIEELGIDFEDGCKIIYVNGTYKGNDKIGRLVSDLMCTNPDDMYNEVLKQRVKYFKEDEGGRIEMCEIWEEIKQKGKLEGKLASLKSLIKNTNMALEEAMNALELTEEEKQICRERLQ